MIFLEPVIAAVIATWLSANEWRFRQMKKSLDDMPSKKEMEQYVGLKSEVLKESQLDLKEDVKRVEDKIDMLIQLQLTRSD